MIIFFPSNFGNCSTAPRSASSCANFNNKMIEELKGVLPYKTKYSNWREAMNYLKELDK